MRQAGPLLSLLRAGVLLFLTAISAAAQTEFPFAAGTDSAGRAQAVSDVSGRVLIESPEFPRGLWVDLVDEGGKALAGIQVAYEGWPDSLVAVHCLDPSGLRQETLLWTRLGGEPLRLVLKPDEPTDLPAGLASIDWRIDPGAEELPVLEEGPDLIGWPAVAAFLEERWRGRTGRVAVQIDGSPVVAVDLAHTEPVERLLDHLQDQARMSLGEIDHSVVQVLFDGQTFESDLALLEGAIVLTTSVVLIQGSELERWILRDLGGGREGPVAWSEAAALTGLNVNAQDVVDVGPLAALTNLEWLNLRENRIVDVGPLAPLTSLESLRLTDNTIVDVSPLAALTNLGQLVLDDNEIGDVGPLAPLTKLESLWLQRNAIVDVSPLAALTNLGQLVLDDNEIVDVSPLAPLTKLAWLTLVGNKIVDVGPLSALTNLWLGLHLDDNEIVDVSPLASLTSLTRLSLSNNEIVDVSPLSALTSLEELHLDNNEIVDVSPLADITSLRVLSLSSNQIVDVSLLASLTSLKWLFLESNQIQDIGPLVANTSLDEGDWVQLEGNPLSDRAIKEQIPALEARGVQVDH